MLTGIEHEIFDKLNSVTEHILDNDTIFAALAYFIYLTLTWKIFLHVTFHIWIARLSVRQIKSSQVYSNNIQIE